MKGIKIVELAGIGPGPMCAMLLADLGATVLRVDRKHQSISARRGRFKYNLLLRTANRSPSISKPRRARRTRCSIDRTADALIEGFRPGVTERLGLGPDVCLRAEPESSSTGA